MPAASGPLPLGLEAAEAGGGSGEAPLYALGPLPLGGGRKRGQLGFLGK